MPITNRQFFCLIGILVYASDVLAITTHSYFNLFRKIRHLCEKLSKDQVWDDQISINLTIIEREKLEKWVNIVQENKPVGLLVGRKEIPSISNVKADVYICLDASKEGWEAVFYNSEKEYKGFKQGIWPRGDYKASSKAEPVGIERTMKLSREELRGKRIAILTDHENICFAARALFIHSFFYNRCLKYLEKLRIEDGTETFIYFVPGARNVADGISRGQREVTSKTFPVVGAGLDMAFPLPWQT